MKPTLVLAVGNLSRGDDALGPMLLERLGEGPGDGLADGLADGLGPDVELLGDFQLMPEHAVDLVGRVRVVFVDASVSAPPPFSFAPVRAARDASLSSHALSPEAVLYAVTTLGATPPDAWVLAIRGHAFELGEGLSDGAAAGLEAAATFLAGWLRG